MYTSRLFSYITYPWIILWGVISNVLVSMLRTGCYVKQMKSTQFCNHSTVIYMGAQVISSDITICWLIQTHKYQCFGFQMHFKSILVLNLKTKREFWWKRLHYIMGYITNRGFIFFYFHCFFYLAYMDYSLCQMWSVYIQYLWCSDHSNKCLFLVIQYAEV